MLQRLCSAHPTRAQLPPVLLTAVPLTRICVLCGYTGSILGSIHSDIKFIILLPVFSCHAHGGVIWFAGWGSCPAQCVWSSRHGLSTHSSCGWHGGGCRHGGGQEQLQTLNLKPKTCAHWVGWGADTEPDKSRKKEKDVRWFVTEQELQSLSTYMRNRITLDKASAARWAGGPAHGHGAGGRHVGRGPAHGQEGQHMGRGAAHGQGGGSWAGGRHVGRRGGTWAGGRHMGRGATGLALNFGHLHTKPSAATSVFEPIAPQPASSRAVLLCVDTTTNKSIIIRYNRLHHVHSYCV